MKELKLSHLAERRLKTLQTFLKEGRGLLCDSEILSGQMITGICINKTNIRFDGLDHQLKVRSYADSSQEVNKIFNEFKRSDEDFAGWLADVVYE